MRAINKKTLCSIIAMIAFIITMIGTNCGYSVFAMENQEESKIILIDPGHGGVDGGAVSKNGTVEKNINLSISLKVKKELENKGYKVLMTRSEDVGLYSDTGSIRNKKNQDLNNRVNMKKESQCDMYVSIHLNIFPQSQYYGAQVWYSNFEGSKKLAHLLQENFKRDLDSNNKRVEKSADNAFKVLRVNDTMPSVIIECGFLSNENEEQKLKTEEYQEKVAQSIANSIHQYYNNENGPQ